MKQPVAVINGNRTVNLEFVKRSEPPNEAMLISNITGNRNQAVSLPAGGMFAFKPFHACGVFRKVSLAVLR